MEDIASLKIVKELNMNITNLRTAMDNTSDLIIKRARIGKHEVAIALCEGMVSTDTIANMIYRPLNEIDSSKDYALTDLMDLIERSLFIALEQSQVQTYKEMMLYIMSGFTLILFDGADTALAIGTQGFKARGVEQAATHLNLRSSREGFCEVIRTNISMVRRRIKSPSLVFKLKTLGDRSNTDICLCYISDKADPSLVQQVELKLEQIDLDTILESGYIQPFLEDKNSILFSEIGTTERPDTLAAKLYEGRIGIIVDGTPFSLYLPHLFSENFQTMDDYTGMPVFMAFSRLLKYFAFAFTILLPGFYIALANFHPELFPNSLLFNLAAASAATPYPLLVECLIIHVIYELMREAGLRLPTYVGHAVSIVGGLVIGEIVVSAGLVGAPIVLIAAVGSISSFVIPDIYDSIIILRFAFIFAGGMWGLYGITIIGIIMVYKICSLSNFGVPYTAPLSPFTFKALRDLFVRISWRKLAKSDVKIQELNGAHISNKKE